MIRPSLRISSFGFALALAGAAACSGGDSKKGGGGGGADGGAGFADGGAGFDAGPRPDAGTAVACADVADFGDLGAIDGQVFTQEGYLSIDSPLDVGPPADIFVMELYEGVAPFVDGFTTGTFEISGDQLEYNTCGVCPTVYGDFTADGSAMIYLAQSGTVTVTSVEGNFTGSFAPTGGTTSYAGFTFDEEEGYVRQADCTVTGGGATWDKAIPAPMK